MWFCEVEFVDTSRWSLSISACFLHGVYMIPLLHLLEGFRGLVALVIVILQFPFLKFPYLFVHVSWLGPLEVLRNPFMMNNHV